MRVGVLAIKLCAYTVFYFINRLFVAYIHGVMYVGKLVRIAVTPVSSSSCEHVPGVCRVLWLVTLSCVRDREVGWVG